MDILLKNFIDGLESLPDKPHVDELKQYAVKMNGVQLPIEKYVSFSDHGYKRNIIYASSKCEVTVICYNKGQYTPIHDHGSSVGITIIQGGTMTEKLFSKQPTGMISPSLTSRYHTGEFACVHLTTIHRVSNVHTAGLVTLNIYFPPLTLMNLYNLKNTQVEKWVADYSHREGAGKCQKS
ncbi:MAG: hypothetical protein E3K32_09900 [wastewater metagenome]|nr:hypothetical protein [Candidatus Loosdrechtia aerotolerans]